MQEPSSRSQGTATAARAWPPPQGEWTYEDWVKLPDLAGQYGRGESAASRLLAGFAVSVDDIFSS